MLASTDFVVWNKELTLDDKNEVGIELASLGEVANQRIDIIPGIIITPNAYQAFITGNNLSVQIKHLLGSINHERHDSLTQISTYISKHIETGVFPEKIATNLFEKFKKLDSHTVTLKAYYFYGNTNIGQEIFKDVVGESVLIEKIRTSWSHLFSPEILKKHTMHSQNHKSFSICISIIPDLVFDLTGTVKTIGKTKSEYEIEAHSMVKFTYNKHAKQISQGSILPGGKKDALTPIDIKKLLNIAHKTEKALYLPQIISWGKRNDEIIVEKVNPISEQIVYNDTFSSLSRNLSVHPGVTIGRLKVIDENHHNGLVVKDEIIMLKKLDRSMLLTLRKAKGLIIEEEPHPEVAFLLKNFGIPTVIRKKHHMLYSTGDVISLNATTGEIKRGSMLVS